MIKINLPVIILRGLVVLPHNDIRLDFDTEDNKSIVETSELFHDNKVLVISGPADMDGPLPKIGTVCQISYKSELANGNVRVVISGLFRAKVEEYLNLDNPDEALESVISMHKEDDSKDKEEILLVRKLYHEVERYVKLIPYINNNLLPLISNVSNLSEMTDIIASQLPLQTKRLYDYLITTSKYERAKMILADIYQDEEMFNLEKSIDSKVRKEMENNQKEYLLREKIKAIKEELGDINVKDDEVEELRNKINKLNAPEKIKERLLRELKKYETLSQASPELNIVRNYIEWMIDLPWNVYTKDNNDLESVREKLDESHHGLDKVKTRIIEFLAVKQMTNSLKSPILCLVGAPGVGKTSLAFSIAESINRNFVKISVGGVNDEAEIVGHRRTYIGANPGRIIQSMKKAKSNNPVFLIDEIDKMTKDYKGDPASALLEILDPEQNKFFSDNYIEEEYDLSQVMFIATANYIDDIPEALKDRLEIINLSGYTEFEKLDIAKRHLLPKVCENHGIDIKKININDNTILKIIREYTKEAGVRELERQLSNIIRKIVTKIVVEKIKRVKVAVDDKKLVTYLGKPKYRQTKKTETRIGVVNGLAYTYFGGDVLPIEVNYYKGNGNLVLTGSLGDVMKESAHIALSYIKSNYQYFNIDYDKLTKNDIHIHVPEGAIPKDGPSAGITLTTSLISALTNLKIDKSIAMTGEITLRGNVLPIGGLKEKSIGAHRNGVKTILIPFDNQNDLDDIPSEIKDSITYIPVKNYKEVVKYLNNY